MSEWMYKFCCVSVAVLFNHSVRFVFWLKYITKCSCYHHTDTVLFEAYCVSRVLSLWIACKSTWHCHSLSSHFIFVCLCDEQTYLCRKIWIAPPLWLRLWSSFNRLLHVLLLFSESLLLFSCNFVTKYCRHHQRIWWFWSRNYMKITTLTQKTTIKHAINGWMNFIGVGPSQRRAYPPQRE